MSNKLPIWLVGLLAIVFIVGGVWIFSPAEVTVVGTGIVTVPANLATFSVTVVATGDDPATALVSARDKVKNIRTVLTSINIAPESVASTEVGVVPASATVVGAKGYQASSTVTVKTSNVAMVGEMVVKMYEAGASIVSQPSISFEKQTELEQEATKKAMDSAKDQLKATVGFRPLKKIMSVEQASSGSNAGLIQNTDGQASGFEVAKVVSVTYRVW